MKTIIKKIFHGFFEMKKAYKDLKSLFITNRRCERFASIGKHTQIATNVTLVPENICCEDYTRIQNLVNFISWKGKLVIKKYSAIASGCTIVPGTHTPTVGVPQFLSTLHINDVNETIVINEDAWVGAASILLSHCSIGRGAIVGAGAVVTKPVPPYAVVTGIPAKIIATRFSKEQIIEHEKILYPPNERLSKKELDDLFSNYFANLKSIGTTEISATDKEKLEKTKSSYGMKDYSIY